MTQGHLDIIKSNPLKTFPAASLADTKSLQMCFTMNYYHCQQLKSSKTVFVQNCINYFDDLWWGGDEALLFVTVVNYHWDEN